MKTAFAAAAKRSMKSSSLQRKLRLAASFGMSDPGKTGLCHSGHRKHRRCCTRTGGNGDKQRALCFLFYLLLKVTRGFSPVHCCLRTRGNGDNGGVQNRLLCFLCYLLCKMTTPARARLSSVPA